MKPRPAFHKRLMAPHPFQWNHEDGTPCCGWKGDDGRPCGLPKTNRHHDIHNPTTQPVEQPEDEQLRLDING